MPNAIPNPTTQAVLTCIQAYVCQHGFAPTRREIASACFMSVGNVARHLDKLEKLGYLYQIEHTARGIVLLQVIDKK